MIKYKQFSDQEPKYSLNRRETFVGQASGREYFFDYMGEVGMFDTKSDKVTRVKVNRLVTTAKLSSAKNFLIVLSRGYTRGSKFKLTIMNNDLSIVLDKDLSTVKIPTTTQLGHVPKKDVIYIEESNIIALIDQEFIYFFTPQLKLIYRLINCLDRTFRVAIVDDNNPFKFSSKDFEEFNLTNLKKDNKEILRFFNLKENFSEDELKRSYRDLIKRYHPDRSEGNQEKAVEIISSYQYLLNLLINRELSSENHISKSNREFGQEKQIQTRDWFCKLEYFEDINFIFLGTYSGRVLGIDYLGIRHFLINIQERKRGSKLPLLMDIYPFLRYQFETAEKEMNLIVEITKLNGNLLVKTGQMEINKKEFTFNL